MSESARRVRVETARSFLFVPGDRPDRFAKARASGADITILDLEDAVAPGAKEASRGAVVHWAGTHDDCIVRVNGVGTPWIAGELSALRGSGVPVMLPKAQGADDVRRVADELAGSPVVGLVETPRGVATAQALAGSGVVARLALGNVDLATALGVDPASQAALSFARGSLVLASAVGGLPAPVDGVSTRLADQRALANDAAQGRELGFGAKLCIHPGQVATVNDTMRPSAEEVAWAQHVLAHAQEGVVAIDGAMVDAPVVARARQVIARAARS